jgi:hypothetical protein
VLVSQDLQTQLLTTCVHELKLLCEDKTEQILLLQMEVVLFARLINANLVKQKLSLLPSSVDLLFFLFFVVFVFGVFGKTDTGEALLGETSFVDLIPAKDFWFRDEITRLNWEILITENFSGQCFVKPFGASEYMPVGHYFILLRGAYLRAISPNCTTDELVNNVLAITSRIRDMSDDDVEFLMFC